MQWLCYYQKITFRNSLLYLLACIVFPLLFHDLSWVVQVSCLGLSIQLWLEQLWTSVFTIIHCKERSSVKADNAICLWVQAQILRRQFDAVCSVQLNNIQFPTRAYDFASHVFLNKFTVPGMDSLLWSWPSV